MASNPQRGVFQNFALVAGLVLLASSFSHAVDKRSESPNVMVVGGIFERNDNIQIIAFKKAIEMANDMLSTATESAELERTRLEPHIIQFDEGDSFDANQKCCSMLSKGVVGVIGPSNPLVSYHVRTLCNEFNIPHLELQWGYRPQNSHFSINVHPYYKSFGRAVLDLIDTFVPYESIAVIYYDEDSLLKFEDLLNVFSAQTVVRRWHSDPLKQKYLIKYLRSINTRRFVVDIPPAHVKDFLIVASTFNLTTEIYSYIFTAWDVSMIDLSAFKVNISTFMITPFVKGNDLYPDGNKYIEDLRKQLYKPQPMDQVLQPNLNMIPTRAALVFDAVLTLVNALKGLSFARSVMATKLNCNQKSHWSHGPSLVNYIKAKEKRLRLQDKEPKNTDQKGNKFLTGTPIFDSIGQRSNFSLDIYETTESGYRRYSRWQQKQGMKMFKRRNTTMVEARQALKNKTLRVTTIADAPFVIVNKKDENGSPLPDGWDGFCIRLLKEIAKDIGFNYTIHIVADGQYGSENNSRWNGMIGELIEGKADLSIASLTITYERERVIDFTTPFMNLGLTILFHRPSGKTPHLFSFLQPLCPEVWGYVLAAYVLVSGILFVVARFSPYEWFNPHPCNPDSDVVENQFNIFNSFWFTIASFLQQGSEHAPKATSTRMIAGIWWFFGLIVISSYTANLAAFLTVERMKTPIENADDLSAQTSIKYGIVKGGSTQGFFSRASYPTYQKMWKFMTSNEHVFMNSNKAGIARVLNNKDYAFIAESTLTEYYKARQCELMEIGGRLDSKGYGIGLPAGSVYRDIISESILKLQKNQVIADLYRYFWKEYNVQTACDAEQKSSAASSLNVEQVGGVFVVLLIGLTLSVMCSVCEFVYKSRKHAHEERRDPSTCSEICKELKFAMQCGGSSKRPNTKQSGNQPGLAESSSRMRMLMDPPPPPPMRDERGSGRWFESDDRFGTQLGFTPRYSPKYPATGSLSPYPLTPSADLHFSDNRLKKVPC